jgi:tetratricopeptide (TPR) repeat protein
MDFYAMFKAGNLWVKSQFFPDLDRANLFDESFESYPDTLAIEETTFAQACEAAAKLWMFQCDRLEKQRARLSRHEASLKSLKEGVQTDLRAAALALQSDQAPQNFDTLSHLFNIFCRLGDMEMAKMMADRAVELASPSQARLLRSRLAKRLTRHEEKLDSQASDDLVSV